MSKSKQKTRVKKHPSSKDTASSVPSPTQTKPLDPEFTFLIRFASKLSYIAEYIRDRENMTLKMLRERKYTKEELTDDLKDFLDTIQKVKEEAREIKSSFSIRFVKLAKEALVNLGTISSAMDRATFEFSLLNAKKDRDLLYKHWLRAYRLANERRCKLQELSSRIAVEANEYFETKGEDSQKWTKQDREDKAIEGEWSRAMTKNTMRKALGLESYEVFNSFAKTIGIRQAGNRQTWQIRLDTCDARTRQKLEKA